MESLIMRLRAAAFLSLAASGCVVAEWGEPLDDEDVQSISAAQLDPGGMKWRLFNAILPNGQPLFRLLVIGGSNVGNYQANTEYWYVNQANLGWLGQSALTFSHTGGNGAPPQLSGSQQFQVPRLLPWAPFSGDQVSGGYRYDRGDLHLRIGTGNGEITRLTWYQTIPAGQNPANVMPSGTFTPGFGAVTVPSGSAGYYIDSTIP